MHFGYSGAKPVCPLNQASCLHNSFAPLPRRQFNLTDAMMMTARETEMERRRRRGRGRSATTPTPTPTSTPQLSVPRTLEVPRARDTLRTFSIANLELLPNFASQKCGSQEGQRAPTKHKCRPQWRHESLPSEVLCPQQIRSST